MSCVTFFSSSFFWTKCLSVEGLLSTGPTPSSLLNARDRNKSIYYYCGLWLEVVLFTKSGKTFVVFGYSWCATSVLGSQVFGQASMESCDPQLAKPICNKCRCLFGPHRHCVKIYILKLYVLSIWEWWYNDNIVTANRMLNFFLLLIAIESCYCILNFGFQMCVLLQKQSE